MTLKSKIQSVCRIQISEPWDFEIPGKGNILNGSVEGICKGPVEKNWQGDYLLITLLEPFTWKGEIIKQLLIAPRCEGDTVEQIWNGKHMMVGIARVKPTVSLKASQSFTPQQVDYFAIGSVDK